MSTTADRLEARGRFKQFLMIPLVFIGTAIGSSLHSLPIQFQIAAEILLLFPGTGVGISGALDRRRARLLRSVLK